MTVGGNVPLSNISVTDDQGANSLLPSRHAQSRPKQNLHRQRDAKAGQYTNTATAQGTPPGGLAAVSATDFSHYFGASPQIALDKKTNSQDAGTAPGPYIPVGNPVAWTYLVTNNGNVSLSGVGVDATIPAVTISCPKTTLTPTESMTCTATAQPQPGNIPTPPPQRARLRPLVAI